MGSVTFASPLFLIGLSAAALPILIHFLPRDRIRRVAFPTLRFFSGASRHVLRRKKLREAILLALRSLACALLAVAFARPLLSAEGAARARTARVLVVDVSASMARRGVAQAAREAALDALNSLGEGPDAAALITFDGAPTLDMPLTRELGKVRARLAALAPGHGATNIPAALERADTLLREAAADGKQIVLISDLQRTGWTRFRGRWKLADGVALTVRKLEPAEPGPPAAIVEADCPQSTVVSKAPRTLAVRIANFGDAERRDVPVTLTLGDQEVATKTVNLRPGARVPVRFRRAFTTPGDNPGTIRLGAPPGHSVHYFNVRVIPRIRVLVLDGRRRRDGARFVRLALAPSEDTPVLVKTVDAAKTPPEEVDDALVAVLANVRSVEPPVRDALTRLLRRGGGILFLPGGQVKADLFNRTFGPLAPCKLRRVLTRGAKDGEAEANITRLDYEHPVFSIFQRGHSADLSSVRFARYWEVTDSQLARVLARFQDARPAVLERQIHAGISMMLVAPAELDWTDFPRHTTFLPFLHEAVNHLAVRTEGRTVFPIGARLPVAKGHTLRTPAGKLLAPKDAVAAEPGFHTVLDAGLLTGLFRLQGHPFL